MVEHFYVKFGDPIAAVEFWDIVWKKHKQTKPVKP